MQHRTQKPGKKPKPENLGPGRAGFHLLKFQVSQLRHQKTQKFRVGFRIFLGFCTLYIWDCTLRLSMWAHNSCNSCFTNRYWRNNHLSVWRAVLLPTRIRGSKFDNFLPVFFTRITTSVLAKDWWPNYTICSTIVSKFIWSMRCEIKNSFQYAKAFLSISMFWNVS